MVHLSAAGNKYRSHAHFSSLDTSLRRYMYASCLDRIDAQNSECAFGVNGDRKGVIQFCSKNGIKTDEI